jgi:hypothetical protein
MLWFLGTSLATPLPWERRIVLPTVAGLVASIPLCLLSLAASYVSEVDWGLGKEASTFHVPWRLGADRRYQATEKDGYIFNRRLSKDCGRLGAE